MKRVGLLFLAALALLVLFDRILMPLYISQGKMKTVPAVTGMAYDNAERELRKAGFDVKKTYHVKYLNRVDPDIVLSQTPESGSLVKPGRTVDLVVNRVEKPTFQMPDLYGRPEFDARQTLERLDIRLENVQETIVTEPEDDGRIISQSVPPRTLVKSGASVSVIIGKLEEQPIGLRKIAVPDVLGMSVSDARQIMSGNGLATGSITYEYSAILVPNTVISQKPGANAFVSPGTPVDLTVVNRLE
ncbi:MAG: PASTA domain-containing protein [Chlorobiaceae bacterium]|jgi:beta-lactam-binding protein with PASTA domain|nr:PASTA domain-containing protein [Chlorobiaceae bacterium]